MGATGAAVKNPVTGRAPRPDVQVLDRDGKVHIIEVAVSQRDKSLSDKETLYRAILGDRFGSFTKYRP